MRNLLIYICALLIASCTFETSGNGELDGAWHLLRVNGKDCERKQVYWNFQGRLLEAVDKDSWGDRFLLRFQRSGNQLRLSEPYIYDRENGDKPLTDTLRLEKMGITDIDEPFNIITINSTRMTLQSSDEKLEFRKF